MIVRRRLVSLLLPLALVLTGGRSAPAQTVAERYEAEPPRPQGTIRLFRPTIEWPIAPRSGHRITGIRLFINGRETPAQYDPEQRLIAYTPETPLPPGLYRIRGEAALDETYVVEQEWTFLLSAELPPPPDDAQAALCRQMNALRARAGLPPVDLDARLCAAAAAHSAYLKRHGTTDHDEEPGRAGFTGRTPRDRLAAAGFEAPCTESVQVGAKTPAEALAALLRAPYHRLALLQPGSPAFGVGIAGDRLTALCATSERAEVVLWPGEGQDDVPCAWQEVEIPDPLRAHPVSGPVGAILSLAYAGPSGGPLQAGAASLTDARGQAISCFLSTPENDDQLSQAILLIPRRPLTPGMRYQVAIEATTAEGLAVGRTWSFTTARPPEAPPAPAVAAPKKPARPAAKRGKGKVQTPGRRRAESNRR